jgi:hypothetical protein
MSGHNASAGSLNFNFSTSSILTDHESKSNRLFAPSLPPIASQPQPTLNLPSLKTYATSETVGAAADLRARLNRIREKSKQPSDLTFSVPPPVTAAQVPKPHTGSSTGENLETLSISLHTPLSPNQKAISEYQSGMTVIDELLRTVTPLPEGSKVLDDSIECMKRLHAALSKQQNVVVGFTSEDLSMLRLSIYHNVDEMIERLARYASCLCWGGLCGT